MSTRASLSSRLKEALKELHISQKEASIRCGLPEQTISNIVTKNMDETKTAGRIALGLGISLEWLVYGTGKMIGAQVRWIPLIDSFYSLGLFLTEDSLKDKTAYIASERNYGRKAFAWPLENGTIVICGEHEKPIDSSKRSYLLINDEMSMISENSEEAKKYLHLICEIRTCYDLKEF
ncbi:helix-turn-helix domain-containing protein [Pseudomonas kitaguniensis]|uniref:helix-turn-helix domain-containing protein n=1 Tax=Pseudomonas kitaguniensis TaxID=2607908 RepID=UPI003BA3A3C1